MAFFQKRSDKAGGDDGRRRIAKDKDGNAKVGDAEEDDDAVDDGDDEANRTVRCCGSKSDCTFKHAGSRITPAGSVADAIVREIEIKIGQFRVYKHPELTFEAAFFEFTKFPNLCEIARFRCTTRPLGTAVSTGDIPVGSVDKPSQE